jgi:hypothetical protein
MKCESFRHFLFYRTIVSLCVDSKNNFICSEKETKPSSATPDQLN